jgi:hypothetical protein
MQPSSSHTTRSRTSDGNSSAGTALAPLTAFMPRSTSELIKDIDPGKLPPRTRQIFSHVGAAIEAGWKPTELAQNLGVQPSFLSELIAELRTALGFVNGVFPTASDADYETLRESIARQGVNVPIVVDDEGVIDGLLRARACTELAHIAQLATELDDYEQIAAAAAEDSAAARDLHGKQTVEDARYLVDVGPDLIALALERRWADPPIDRRTSLTPVQRRQLAISLNAHRRHLDRGQLRLLVEVELMLDPSRPNTAIATLVGCTHQWVAQIRQQLIDDEARFANPQAPVEVQVLEPKRLTELDCPHCHGHLALLRAGREFQLELTAA